VLITVFGVAMALSRKPNAVAAMQEADWEIASYGYDSVRANSVEAGGSAP